MNRLKMLSLFSSLKSRVNGTTTTPRDYVYLDCYIHETWKTSEDFVLWAQSIEYYQDGWQLDKDILVKGNRVYGPDTCVFVPQQINKLLVKANSIRGDYPIGVKKHSKNTFRAQCCDGFGNQVYKNFRTVEEAFNWYKETKESVIKSVAARWKDQIDPRVYQALIDYKVEITD